MMVAHTCFSNHERRIEIVHLSEFTITRACQEFITHKDLGARLIRPQTQQPMNLQTPVGANRPSI